MSDKVSLPSLGSPAPQFAVNSTAGHISLGDYKGKWVILFSHPGDFTPICTTEFLAFAQANHHFESRNAQLLGLSIDSNASHIAWLMNILSNTGVKIPFPVIDDRSMKVARDYGMLSPSASDTATVRTVFYIDPNQIIRAILYYPMTNGRNISEIIRLLDALQYTDENNVFTPANWVPGRPAVYPPPQTFEQAEATRNHSNTGSLDWYLNYTSGDVSKNKT